MYYLVLKVRLWAQVSKKRHHIFAHFSATQNVVYAVCSFPPLFTCAKYKSSPPLVTSMTPLLCPLLQVPGFLEELWRLYLLVHCSRAQVGTCHVMSCHVMSCHVMSCQHWSVVSGNIMTCHVMSRHITSYHVMSCHVSCHAAVQCGIHVNIGHVC